ncbi:MAG TPA: homoserine dehydrogenase, partial [Firmicutes bacterium]|nr:homoserine dehydrogenase [Bacillota bacterium]
MAVKKQVKLAIIGLGTVGSGVVEVINRNRQSFVAKTGSDILIKKALVRDITRPRRVDLTGIELTDKPEDVLEDPDIDVVVELMGGVDKAGLYIAEALRRGKYVVTANKDLLAQKGVELMRLAREMGKGIYYEASVGGGIPLIRPLKHCLAANKIKKILGIINGTTNYILTRMTYEQMEFSEALAEAQAKGFAEQDPSSDIEGKDAAFKLAILAADAFHSEVDINKVYREGIADVKLRDILYAEELGFIVKLLAIGEESEAGISLKVHPTLIPKTHPLAGVLDEFNAVLLEGDAVGEVMFYGRGAGSLPTA